MIRTPIAIVAFLILNPYSNTLAKDYNLGGKLIIQVYKDPDTLGAGIAHDHVMLARDWVGTASYDSLRPSACEIKIKVPVDALEVDPESLRKALGYTTRISADQRNDIRTHMLSESQLNAQVYPNITFRSTECTDRSVSGTLTIRGKSQLVTMRTRISENGKSFSAHGSLTIRASQFGFQPYSAFFGQLKNRDDMKLTIKVTNIP